MATMTEERVRDRIADARRIVVKVGSALLVDHETGELRADWMAGLAMDLKTLRDREQDVVLVSSGAIALGRRMLKLAPGLLSLEQAQAAAAVGQTQLVRAWQDALSRHDILTAQVLLTLEDTQNRRRYLNGRATLASLLGMGAVPIVNENDTVATDEIRYGDNDRLAARVALMSGADVLVLLSDIDGLYTSDPRGDDPSEHIAIVSEITPAIDAMAGGAASDRSRGGMHTKILAAKTALQGGCAMAVARGDVNRPLSALRDGARSTWFLPATGARGARKQWIAGMKPLGTVVIDAGAVRALSDGKSLLPAGVHRIEGDFERGDPVAILDQSGVSVGAALASYRSEDAVQIAGLRSDRIADVLGYPGRAAMIHRDDLVLWGA